jgi:hypothetical protein
MDEIIDEGTSIHACMPLEEDPAVGVVNT